MEACHQSLPMIADLCSRCEKAKPGKKEFSAKNRGTVPAPRRVENERSVPKPNEGLVALPGIEPGFED